MSGAGQSDETRGRRRRARARRDRVIAGAAALAGHALLLAALLSSRPPPPTPPELPPIELALVAPAPGPPLPSPPAPHRDPSPSAAAAPAAEPTPEPPKPARKPPPVRLIRDPEPSEVPPRLVPPPEPAPPATEVQVSEAQLASATTAESEAAGLGGVGAEGEGFGAGSGGGGGGRCDMVARLQRALREDPRVRVALAQVRRAPGFTGRPLVVWNGDWVRHGEEEGKGLASVRQAISVEVAFAPKACRAQSMHGLVLLSLNDSPAAARVVLGAGFWRWSDLLFAR